MLLLVGARRSQHEDVDDHRDEGDDKHAQEVAAPAAAARRRRNKGRPLHDADAKGLSAQFVGTVGAGDVDAVESDAGRAILEAWPRCGVGPETHAIR